MANNWIIDQTVDLKKGIDGFVVWPHALLVEGDEKAHEWRVKVMDDGKPAELNGSVMAYFVRADRTTVIIDGKLEENVVSVTLTQECYAYNGDLQAIIRITNANSTVTISALLLLVRNVVTNNFVDPDDVVPSLEVLLREIESMRDATEKANNSAKSADDAVDRMNSMLDKTNEIVNSANKAVDNANKAVEHVENSADIADAAANSANEAAERANAAVAGVIVKKVVGALPPVSQMEDNVLYLVPRDEGKENNEFDEYMLINGSAEIIGNTTVDLDGYAKINDLARVAISGKYSDLSGTPQNISSFFNDANYQTAAQASALYPTKSDLQTSLTSKLDIMPGAGFHNAIYRGKSLGSSVSAAQYAAIAAGTFDDIYIGDFWTISGINWRVAAFDYYLNTGSLPCTDHHVVIVPDVALYNFAMNDAATSDGGYTGSKMYASGLNQAKSIIQSAFGAAHLLTHSQYFSGFFDSTVDLMSEINVYGGSIFRTMGGFAANASGMDKCQYPLFALDPSRICNRDHWWLRDPVGTTDFCYCDGSGISGVFAANNAFGVRPAFCIKS